MPLQLPPSTSRTTSLAPNNIPAILSKPKHQPATPTRRSTSARDLSASASRNSSSGLVWAEDYCPDIGSTSPGDKNKENLPSPPRAAATSSSKINQRSVLSSSEEDSYQPKRSPQRTLTALLPFRSNPSSRSPSPTKVDTEQGDYMATLTGDKDGIIKVADRRSGLSSWFTGSSAPVTVGVPIMEQESTTSATQSRDTSPARLQNIMTGIPTTPRKTNTGGGGMFNFFSPKSPAKTPTIQIPAELNDDEFFTLDVHTALFPSGSPTENDPFSPAAFKNLLMNAEGLLSKLQTAYKIRTLSLHDFSVEKEAMTEELEEAETRAQCLKSQLEDMAHQMSVKDNMIAELAAGLATEKQARAEEKLAREQSIALVKARAERDMKRGSSNSEISVGEDLGISISGRRRNRASDGSSEDSGSEYEVESVFDSTSVSGIGSRCRSPTLTVTTTSGASIAGTVDSSCTPEIMQASFARVVPNPGLNSGRPKLLQQKSTFQKILSGIGSTSVEEEGTRMGEEGCSNCRGRDASVAWDTVGLMRAENKGLKDRVGELEIAVECALDVCNGLT
ncbi:uncharacterized protein RCO7_08830 [Rhynchosporium graminicola]|uniref:Uncharacterized protein n=1 Tax=Rhynchosporium graminicola TaxID=2792576 RepID=A0A1E1KCY8_9HELO|nr:uncharacterized protein RCO7_08830 [Rhynchosporium commune]